MKKQMKANSPLWTTLFLGLSVAGLSLSIGWRPVVEASNDRVLQSYTISRLQAIDTAIRAYYQKKGSLPRSLNQIHAEEYLRLNVEKNGSVLDSWRHPIIYSVADSDYHIVSLGRDGKLGGSGVNCDLSNDNINPFDAKVTFDEFLHNPMAINCFLICLLAGSTAGYRSGLVLYATNSSQKNSLKLILRLSYVTISTLFVTYPFLLLSAALQRH